MSLQFKGSLVAYALCTILSLTGYSCNTDSQPQSREIQKVNINDLTIGPIVHDTLSAVQIDKIKKIQLAFQEVNPSSLEETMTDFKRDRNPDHEIEIWLEMASAYEQFTSKRPSLAIEKKQEVYKLILIRSMEDVERTKAAAKTNLKLLTDEEIAEAISYYHLEAKPITIEQR